MNGWYLGCAHVGSRAHAMSELIEVALLAFFLHIGASVNHILGMHIHHVNDP